MSDPISNKGEFGKALQSLMMRMGKPSPEQRKALSELGKTIADHMQAVMVRGPFDQPQGNQMNKERHDVRPDI